MPNDHDEAPSFDIERALAEERDERHIEAVRALTPEQRLTTAFQLLRTARLLTTSGVRARHPEWSESRVAQEASRIFLRARS